MLKVLVTIGFLQALTMLVNLVRTKTLAVLLGPDGMGVMAVVDKLLAILSQTALLSLPYAAVRFLPELWSRSPDEFTALIGRMRNLLAVLALMATLVGVLVTLVYPQLWGQELLPYQFILCIAFFSLPVLVFVPFLQSAFAARLQPNTAMLFGLGHAVVLTLAGILGVWWHGLGGLYLLYAIFGLLLVLPVMRSVARIPGRAVDGAPRGRRFSIGLPRHIWTFSLALSGLTFLTPFAALWVHYEVLSHFGATTAGWMQAAMGIGFIVRNVLGRAHNVYLTPNINRGGSPEQRMQWADEFQTPFSWVCVVSMLPVVLFPHFVAALLYSPQFLPAAPFVAVFVVEEVLALLGGTYRGLVVALDHITFHVTQNIVAQGVLLVVAILLVERYGILGAGMAGISAQLTLNASSLLFLRWTYGLRIPRRSGPLALFVLIALGLGGCVGVLYPELSFGVLVGKLLIYGIFVVGLGWFLSPADRANLSSLMRRVQAQLHMLGALGRS